MLIVLTAATSFLGHHLHRCLTAGGHEVVATYRSNQGVTWNDMPGQDRTRYIRLDLADTEAVNRLLPRKIDGIVHVAGVSAGHSGSSEDMVRCNVLGTANLIRYALSASATRFVHASTISVHGRVTVPVVDEFTPSLDPDSYGASKLLGERLMAEVADRVAVLALRLPGILGPGAHRAWIPRVVDSLSKNWPVTVYNPQASFNNAVHVGDIATLTLDALAAEWHGFHALPIAAAGMTRVGDAVELLRSEMGSQSSILQGTEAKTSFTISSNAAIRLFGYAPMDITAMLRLYVREFLSLKA